MDAAEFLDMPEVLPHLFIFRYSQYSNKRNRQNMIFSEKKSQFVLKLTRFLPKSAAFLSILTVFRTLKGKKFVIRFSYKAVYESKRAKGLRGGVRKQTAYRHKEICFFI